MKALFFIGSLTGGGAERVTLGLANYLVGNGHQASLVTMHDTDRDFYVPDSGVGRVCLNLANENRGVAKLTANWRRLRALRSAVHAEQPDVVVGMMPTATILCILACVGLRCRVVGSERNYPGRKPIARSWGLLRRLLYRFADAHVAQTPAGAEWIIRHAAARNVAVIPNAISWPIPACPPHVAPDSVFPRERHVILAVGSKAEQKGFDLLLSAYARIAHDYPGWDLVFVGLESDQDQQTGARAQLQRQAEVAGLVERVHFPGRVGNVADWYERADLFVLSSRYEGFPNVLLEAMAARCACVAFDCDTGPRDVIEHGVNGLLVNAEDVSALADSIERMAGDESLRHEMGARARRVVDDYAESRVLNRWVEVLESV